MLLEKDIFENSFPSDFPNIIATIFRAEGKIISSVVVWGFAVPYPVCLKDASNTLLGTENWRASN